MFTTITDLSPGDVEVMLDALEAAASDTGDNDAAIAYLRLMAHIAKQVGETRRFDFAIRHLDMVLGWAEKKGHTS